jgi:photosystem II stability/assembly factor-like uncharacterized protein
MPVKTTPKHKAKSESKTRKAPTRKGARLHRVELYVSTIKGAFILKGDGARRAWSIGSPHFLGSETNHLVRDPRDRTTMLLAARTGHLGPTVFRSNDNGRTWREARLPPAFPKAQEGQPGPVVNRTFFLAPGHASEPGVWWAGTIPHALFRSEDGGATWEHQREFSRYVAELKEQKPANIGETPGGAITHSILIDPRQAAHMYVSLSTGGFFETTDAGHTWRPLNGGSAACFLPDPSPEYGQDPHCAVMSPANPDRIYQQNHCGVYRLDRPGTQWDRIGRNLPKLVGDIGFPIVAHPRDQDVAWVFPMDGTSVWPRTSPGGKPAVFCSRNGGESWVRQARGFPESNGWFTVFRQAMKADTQEPAGLYLGTTAGEVWASRDEGSSWKLIGSHLPRILSLEVGES